MDLPSHSSTAPNHRPGIKRRALLSLLVSTVVMLTPCASMRAQSLSDVVNVYAPVTAITNCTITLPTTSGFAAGDRILVIQMQGAVIDQSNSAGFGTVVNAGNAGNFEFATVTAVTPTTLALKNRLVRAYTPSDHVQVLRVPSFTDITVIGAVTCPQWNGSTGGVVAMEATGTLALNSGIDVSGLGFRGGAIANVPTACGGTNLDFFYTAGSLMGANKGEGIAAAQTAWTCGRGAIANGGGGGNNHNGGGGGGANFGAGGYGGSEWSGCSTNNGVTRGVGGYALGYAGGTRAWMGGGGGAGHMNEASGTAGGSGGGIVILRAGTIRGAGRITSNGVDVPLTGGTYTDGCGGGGAGGSVLLDVGTYGNTVSVEVKGGAGGSTPWSIGKIGPGGGGGGGIVWTSGAAPGNVVVTATAGANGRHTPDGDIWGSTPGTAGAVQTGLVVAEGNIPTLAVNITPNGPLTICDGDSLVLSSTPGFAAYRWSPNGGANPVAVVRPVASGQYSVIATAADGCMSVATIDITVLRAPKADAGPDLFVCAGSRIAIGRDAVDGTPPYTYAWSPTTDLSTPNNAQTFASPASTTMYTVTVGDSKGECISRDTVVVTVFPTPQLPRLRDTTICHGTSITIGAPATSGTPPLRYAWTPGTAPADSTRPTTVVRPTSTTDYILRVIDAHGCVAVDTVRITVRAPFTTSIRSDTTICAGDSVTLAASGGSTYLWSPAAGLSCTTCRTPRASPALSTRYTAAITDTNGCTQSDSVLVTVTRIQLGGTAGLLDFGSLEGCTFNAERTIVLRNPSTDTVRLDSATFSASGFTVLSPTFPRRIAPDDSVQLRLRFTPSGTGVFNARLHVQGRPCGAEYLIDVRGEKSLASVAVDPAAIAFGDVLSCSTTPIDTIIFVHNTGTGPLTLDGGIASAPFAVGAPSFPRTVPPGDSLAITLRFAPTTEGNAASTIRLPITIGGCNDTLNVPVTGRYIVPGITGLASVNFGRLIGCRTEADTTVRLHNPSIASVTLQRVDLPAGFQALSPLPITIEPGADTAITLRFAPQGNGTAGGRMLLVFDPCNDTLAVDIAGEMSGVSYAVADTIDFGSVLLCTGAADTFMLSITNTSGGGIGGAVAGIALTGPFASTIRPGDTLLNGRERRFAVVFSPTADGDAIGTMELTLAPCGTKRTITLKGTARGVSLTGDPLIDFAAVGNGTTGHAVGTYTNTGTTDLTIDGINGPGAPFAVESTQPPLPAILKPGEALTVRLRFDATHGRHAAAMRVNASPCAIAFDVPVRGEGVDRTAWAAVSLPLIEAAPGQIVTIAPTIDSSRNLIASGVTQYSAHLRFNKTLLIPTGTTPLGTVQGNERIVELQGARADTLGPMFGFAFMVALGDAEETPLTLELFEWRDGTFVATTTANGVFRLRNVCREGDTRLLLATGPAGLKPTRPNPASDNVEVEYRVIETGRAQLYVVDMLGRRVATLLDGPAVPGSYTIAFDAARLAAGVYFCVLTTGVDRFMQGLRIAR